MTRFQRRTLLAALLLCAAVLPACRRAEPPARHLLLVTLDTTRADHLGCYGRQGAGTPWLDALAARGVRVERAYSQVPLTLPSHVSILTGLYPPHHGVRNNGQTTLAGGVVTLADRLSREGFYTAAAVGGFPVIGTFPTRQGFAAYDDHLDDPHNARAVERPAAGVVDAALRLAGQRGGRRLFLWVQLFDPHDPYEPPSPYREQFASDPYQGEIASVDAALARLAPALAKELGDEPLLVAVVGDHGEGLGEHGEPTHGLFLYETTLRVPMLLAGPRVPHGRVVAGPAQTVDLAPTLLDLLGLPVPAGLDGTRLDFEGQGAHTVYSETELPFLNYRWSPLAAAVAGNVKYISAPKPELYDLRRDPRETSNQVKERPEDAQELARFLATLRDQAAAAPAAAVVPDPALVSLGYVGTGAPVKAGPLADPKDKLALYVRYTDAARFLEAGRPADALPLLDALLREEDGPGVRLQRVTALRMLGRIAEADRELKALDAANPGLPGAAIERTRIAIAEQDWRSALAAADEHLRLAPLDAEALMLRGAAKEFLGNPAGAEADYRASMAANPSYGAPGLRLAALLANSGRIPEARAVLTDHLARHPDDRLARDFLAHL